MGVFVYAFFGTSKDISLGPTAILSLLTASIINSYENDDHRENNVPLAVLLTLLSGLVQLLLGLLNLGELHVYIILIVGTHMYCHSCFFVYSIVTLYMIWLLCAVIYMYM